MQVSTVETSSSGSGDVAVFPRPRQVDLGGGRGSAVEIVAVRDPRLHGQGYELEITEAGTRVRHADDAGLRYARHTLAQLTVLPDLPTGRIRDWPDFAHRGFMLDISRDRVPTMATLDWLIDTLADLRYNHLELYTEHTFAYADHEIVWRDASPITPDELRHLDVCCRDAGIELSANQNTFGHMNRWLAHPAYRDRAECPDGSEDPVVKARREPWSLEPTPANAAFALSLVREMAGNLVSRRVHINADEPFDLGRGKSRSQVAERGKGQVFLEHLHRLVEPLVGEERDVLFWGDALVRHPELMTRLPEGGTAVVWTYEAPRPDGPSPEEVMGPALVELLGLPDRSNLGFASFVEPYADAGYPFWVAPGTSSWNSLLGRWSNARRNLLDAATVGLDTGATGFLVTDWGDLGHPQPLAVSLPALSYGAGVAWCRATNHDTGVAPVVDRLLDADVGVGTQLAVLGNLYARLGIAAYNGSPLLLGMVKGGSPFPLEGELGATVGNEIDAILGEAIEQFVATPFHGARAKQVAAELTATCRLARYGLHRLRQDRGDGRVDTAALARDFAECVELQREAWLSTSRPGGLEDSLAKLAKPR